jgi:hypothetical protein
VCGRIDSDGEGKKSYLLPDLSDDTTEYFCQFLAKCTRHMNWLHCPQYVSFCDWDICMIKRSLYDELGGFDQQRYPTRMAMLDLCLKASEQGWRILYTPYALGHLEGEQEPKVHDSGELRQEKLQFQHQWGSRLRQFDTYFNRGLLGANGVDPEAFMLWLCGDGE